MRKKILMFLLLLGAMVTFSACAHRSGPKDTSEKDSITAVSENPTFNSVAEVLIYKDALLEKQYEDSVFLHIPERSLNTIVEVLIKRDGCATKKSIADEFRLHYEKVYKYIPEPSQESSNIKDSLYDGVD